MSDRLPMTALTTRMPDEKLDLLKGLARSRHTSVSKIIDDLATMALATHDAELRCQILAADGDPRRALEILERLDTPGAVAEKPRRP